jgi:Ser/Thr protein kinase RdoA (MazF antagonist)
MAALAARTWELSGDESLLPFGNRWKAFNDEFLVDERARGYPDPVPRIATEGWERFAVRASPAARDVVFGIRRDLRPLVDALAATPRSFLHGDWKLGNVGFANDGRTILLDWTYCGFGPVTHELAWHLALNRARLPHSKEDTIDALAAALRTHGVSADGWWDRQVGLGILGGLVQFGWEKALGDDAELAWWCDRALDGARWL